jgi:methionyl aminopeptidase
MVTPGVTTQEIDKAVRSFIESKGAKPSFLGYNGYSGSACISVNEQVIHGIPGKRKLLDGDIVSIDVGAELDGFHGDCAATFACGNVGSRARKLTSNRESFFAD